MQVEVVIKAVFDRRDAAEAEAMRDALDEVLAALPVNGVSTTIEGLSPAPSEVMEPEPTVADETPLPAAKRGRPAKAVNGSLGPAKTSRAKSEPAPEADLGGDTGDTDDLGLDLGPAAAAELSPEEMRETGMHRLRLVYAAPGGKEKVNALQKRLKLARWQDLPLEQAAELLAAANVLAQELKVRV